MKKNRTHSIKDIKVINVYYLLLLPCYNYCDILHLSEMATALNHLYTKYTLIILLIIITLLYSISVYVINEHRSLDDLNPRNLLLSIKYNFYTTEQVIQARPVSSIILQCIKMLKE